VEKYCSLSIICSSVIAERPHKIYIILQKWSCGQAYFKPFFIPVFKDCGIVKC
jgi:hypothetical protein